MQNNKKLASLLEKKEKLESNLAEKRKRLNAEIQKLRNVEATKERKARTRRLIQIGGIVEKVLGRNFSDEELPLFQKFLEEQENRGKYFSKSLQKSNDLNNNLF